MLSRRSFLRSSATAVGGASLAPVAARASGPTDYKALVFVYLDGGIDCHEVLIGYDMASYDLWRGARQAVIDRLDTGPNAGIRARDNLLALDPLNADDFGGRQFAMPPEFSGLHTLFQSEKLAIIPNVGPLIEPTDRAMVDAGTALYPMRLRSHNDQRSTWQALSVEGARTGWGGEFLDAFQQTSPYTGISLAGQSVFLSGKETRQINLPSSGNITEVFGGSGRAYGSRELATKLLNYYKTAGLSADNALMRDIMNSQAQAIDNTDLARTALAGKTLGDAVRISGNDLSEQLATVANVIEARDDFGVNRQVFFVRMVGYDSHSNLTQRLPDLLTQLSDALLSFQNALDSAGLTDMVTTMTGSEFGRTLVSNAQGTDHGWGGHHFAMGGAVAGGRIAGAVPEFDVGNINHEKRGSLIPQISLEQYGSEFGRWFGLTNADLDTVFPNRDRFETAALGVFR
ncbi:MAG: DUF1501 domain-containing protein [Pseudomonadota bacterium]